jgi:hypothetical protein
MSKPWVHAKSSARKHGGKPDDYIDIHNMMDSSKGLIADVRHRALFHHAYGPFIMEKIFGVMKTNSEGKEYSVRDVAEEHILEDLGTIPTFQDYLKTMEIETWMGGVSKKIKYLSADNLEPVDELPRIPACPLPSISDPPIFDDASKSDIFLDGASNLRDKLTNKTRYFD